MEQHESVSPIGFGMAAPKRTKIQRAADLVWLEKLYLHGTTNQDALAELLAGIRPYRISARTIGNDMPRPHPQVSSLAR